MGLKNGISYLHCLKNLTFVQLLEVARSRNRSNNNHNPNTTPTGPCIDVDCSWVVRKRMCIDVTSSVDYCLSIASSLSKEGIQVMLVCDGVIRHHSKRATVQRKAAVQRKKLDLIISKGELIQLSRQRQSTDSIIRKKEIEADQKKIQAKVQSLEKNIQSSNIDVGDCFYNTLVEEIERLTEKHIGTNGGTINACQAKFQADSVMSARMKNNETDLLLTCDSDQAALLGDACICVKNFKFHAKEKKMYEIDMFFASRVVLDEVVRCLGLPVDSDKIVAAKYPVFESVVCPRLRSLIAVSVGCDVNLFPIMTSQEIYRYISSDTEFVNAMNNENTDDAYLALKKKVMLQYQVRITKKPNATNKRIINSIFEVKENKFSEMVDVFVDAFLFEPATINKSTSISVMISGNNSTYIHFSPTNGKRLHPYISAFDINPYEQQEVDCCDDILYCHGAGIGQHIFMKAEGYCACTTCNVTICKQCVCQKQNGDNHYCYDCYLPELSVTGASETNKDYPSINVIRNVLRQHGMETNEKDNLVDILDIYEAFENKHCSTKQFTGEILLNKSVSTPTHNADYLQTLTRNAISSFDFKNGGQFVVDSRLNRQDVFQIIKTMAQLVNISNEQQKDSYKNRTYQLLPSMLIQFAEGARVQSGYRLIKRCIRHAIDPQTNSILEASGMIVRHCNHPAIVVHHRMKASMKNATYDVTVAFTSDHLISCKCSCKAGCHGEGRVMCVHILPVLYQITMLMYDGLAENILIEVSHHWTRRLNNTTDDSDKENNVSMSEEELKRNLLLIRSACEITGDEENNQTIQDMLEKFNVGTEKGKKITLPPRDPKLLGPLRKQNLESSRIKAKRRITVPAAVTVVAQIETNNSNNNNGEIHPEQQQSPALVQHPLPETYRNIVQCIHVFINFCRSSDPSFLKDTIGYKLLEQRSAPYCYEQPGDVTLMKQKIRKLLNIANQNEASSVRTYNRTNKKNKSRCTLPDSTSANLVQQQAPDCTFTSTTTNLELDDNNDDNSICTSLKQEPTKTNEKSVGTAKYHSCCCCSLTNRVRTDLIFSKVPMTTQKEIKDSDNNKKRETYFKRLFHRKEYLRRLGLKTNDKRKGLEICSQHEMEKALVEYLWIDQNGHKQKSKAYFNLPQDPSCKPLSQCKTRGATAIRQPANPRRKQQPRNYCCPVIVSRTTRKVCNFKNCCSTWYNNKTVVDLRFRKIPPRPPMLLNDERKQHRNYFLMTHDIKSFFFKQTMSRIGLDFERDKRKDIRICNKHRIEKVQTECEWFDNKNKKRKVQITMFLPSSEKNDNDSNNNTLTPTRYNNTSTQDSELSSSSSKKNRMNKGLGTDRLITRQLQYVKECGAASNGVQSEMFLALIQTWEQQEGRTDFINPVVARVAGIEEERTYYDNIKVVFPKTIPATTKNTTTSNNNVSSDQYDYLKADNDNNGKKRTIIRLCSLSDKKIKITTGFPSVVSFLSFVAVICNGEPDKIGETVTSTLTWLEEWLLYFEFVWGRSAGRWKDLVAKYDVDARILRSVFDSKLEKHTKTINYWPKYATLHEDEQLRKEKWGSVYGESRIVMWDNTDVRMYKPSDSDAQRNTYSAYYAGNVAKGGVFIQPCGWMGSHELWVGAVSDSEYMERSGILTEQTKYIKEHDSTTQSIPWTIILDKGYRITVAAWRAGGQFVLQPSFAKSDCKFTANETIMSSTVASDRAANERAVKYMKLSHYIKKGLLENQRTSRLSDVWIAWGFQCNFLYKPVL